MCVYIHTFLSKDNVKLLGDSDADLRITDLV